jgi:hypothetical protein
MQRKTKNRIFLLSFIVALIIAFYFFIKKIGILIIFLLLGFAFECHMKDGLCINNDTDNNKSLLITMDSSSKDYFDWEFKVIKKYEKFYFDYFKGDNDSIFKRYRIQQGKEIFIYIFKEEIPKEYYYDMDSIISKLNKEHILVVLNRRQLDSLDWLMKIKDFIN